MSRKKSVRVPDLRSRITHENASLGGGIDGSIPVSSFSRGTAGLPLPTQQQAQQYHQQQAYHPGHAHTASNVSVSSFAGMRAGAPQQQQRPPVEYGMPRSGSNDMLSTHSQQSQQHHHLGAGPSFVSLSPSDSISNYEGRAGGGGSGGASNAYGGSSHLGAGFEPSAASVASFAQAQEGGPIRPARSMRRPQGAPPLPAQSRARAATSPSRHEAPAAPPAAGRNLLAGGRGARAPAATDRHATSARLMANVNGGGVDGASSGGEEDTFEDAETYEDPRRPRQREPTSPSYTSPTVGTLSKPQEPAALNSVLSALSAAGRKKGAQRILRGTTAEEESKRRKTERKVEDARAKESRPLESYVDKRDERAFRTINAVLRKVKAEWGFVADDDFNAVSLALSLLDESSLGSNRREFEEMKRHIESSLQGTVDDHYESFASAITLHNGVLQSLGAAQSSVSGARRRLRESREALGQKRADLVQLWQRSQGVKESLRLLDIIEQLKGVPDRLESLMSEKRFLQAVHLLTRSLKMIEKPDIADVGATADLRTYLKTQEQGMLEILIEELHNHLYLKSFFCDARWKSYVPGQEALPSVEFGQEYDAPATLAEGDEPAETLPRARADGEAQKTAASAAAAANDRPLKLSRYLTALSTRPAFDESLANDFGDLGLGPSLSGTGGVASDAAGPKTGAMPGSHSTDSLAAHAASGGLAADGGMDFGHNPEADSFLYIEMLLEALARLGKLSLALDVVQQRLPVELHQLVDATIEEVDSRNGPLRGASAGTAMQPESVLLASSSALARSFAESTRSSFRSSVGGAFSGTLSSNGRPHSTVLRLSEIESSSVVRDSETMRDLFWTLFSKLDAVLQGHRVVHEVASKIASRADSKDAQTLRKTSPSSLVAVWRPIQNEVRTLLHDHLTDDSQSASARRNAVISVNEVLRSGQSGRDRSKKLFRLAEPNAGRGSGGVAVARRDAAPLRRHEEALTAALRASVPGLVSALDNAGSSISAQQQYQQQQVIVSATRTAEHAAGGGYRLLVKPDAFNVSVLFQPALAFVERAQIVIPGGAAGGEAGKGFSAFLDEFVQDVFLPQLDEKVQSLFQSAVGGPDAFQEDPASRSLSQRPIVKSAANVIVLIDSLYSMLRTTPFHRESYSHLIIQTIVQYFQRCHERFQDLIAADVPLDANGDPAPQDGPPHMLSATWAQRPELSAVLAQLLAPTTSSDAKRTLHAQENRFELTYAARNRVAQGQTGGSVRSVDMITSRKRLMALGNLQHSMRWFLVHVSRLRATEKAIGVAPAPTARLSIIGSLAPKKASKDEGEDRSLPLPLGADMAMRFAAIPRTFGHLADTILMTLRLELRARTIHHLDLAISEGNYLVEEAVLEPDPHVVDLNAELASLDDTFADSVSPEQHRFLFSGLVSLMDTMLCAAVRRVRAINAQGVTKMIRNILALQQNLRNIVIADTSALTTSEQSRSKLEANREAIGADTERWNNFDRSRRLWELLTKEPSAMLSTIRTTPAAKKATFDEYRSALTLMLGLDNSAGSSSSSGAPTTPTSAAPALTAAGAGGFPGASLRPGTTHLAKDVSRQKFNELLIELHEVAGDSNGDLSD